jgi:hypothetical protein
MAQMRTHHPRWRAAARALQRLRLSRAPCLSANHRAKAGRDDICTKCPNRKRDNPERYRLFETPRKIADERVHPLQGKVCSDVRRHGDRRDDASCARWHTRIGFKAHAMLWRRPPKISVAKSKGAVIACLFPRAAKSLILHVQICVEVCSTHLECDFYGTHFGAKDCFVLKDCCRGEEGTIALSLLAL